jgi:hypothetical protein
MPGNLYQQLYKLLYTTHNILVENDIWYIADGGTLLGAERHGGIIPWDNDVDINVLNVDMPAIKKLKASFNAKGYSMVNHPEGWIKIKDKSFPTAVLDMLPLHIEDGRTRWDIGISDWDNYYHKIEDIFPLEKTKFGSGYIFTVNNPKPYLDRAYGKTWLSMGFKTQDPDTHYDLDKPIKVKVTKFVPAKPFANSKMQIKVKKGSPYTKGETKGWCKEFREIALGDV